MSVPAETKSAGPPIWFTREIGYGDEGDDVLIVQRKVDAPMTGIYDSDTAVRVRGVQKRMGAEQSGIVDTATAERLGEKATAGQVPEWFTPDCDCPEVRRLLGHPAGSLSDAVRRFQSEHGLPVTGSVDEATAVALADRAF